MKMPTLMATLVTVLGAVRSATAQIPPACGYVVNRVCPGCTPSVPADSTCSCGAVDTECKCRKSSGGVQSGEIVTCETNDFGTVEHHPGYELNEGPARLCSSVKTCTIQSGSQICGAYYAGPPPGCDIPISNKCQWRISTTSTAPTFTEGDPCE